MDNKTRYQLLVVVPPILVAMVAFESLLLGYANGAGSLGWIGVLLSAVLCGLWARALFFANHWRRFRPPPGMSFSPRAAELPLVADHRDVFGPGRVENLVEGDGWQAFELVRASGRRWFFVRELAGDHGRWHVHPPHYNHGSPMAPTREFADRYDTDGIAPPAEVREVLERCRGEVDLRLAGDLLVATDPHMTPTTFTTSFLKVEAAIVEAVAETLEPPAPPAPAGPTEAPRAIGRGGPARNVWEPPAEPTDDDRVPEPVPVWEQPSATRPARGRTTRR